MPHPTNRPDSPVHIRLEARDTNDRGPNSDPSKERPPSMRNLFSLRNSRESRENSLVARPSSSTEIVVHTPPSETLKSALYTELVGIFDALRSWRAAAEAYRLIPMTQVTSSRDGDEPAVDGGLKWAEGAEAGMVRTASGHRRGTDSDMARTASGRSLSRTASGRSCSLRSNSGRGCQASWGKEAGRRAALRSA